MMSFVRKENFSPGVNEKKQSPQTSPKVKKGVGSPSKIYSPTRFSSPKLNKPSSPKLAKSPQGSNSPKKDASPSGSPIKVKSTNSPSLQSSSSKRTQSPKTISRAAGISYNSPHRVKLFGGYSQRNCSGSLGKSATSELDTPIATVYGMQFKQIMTIQQAHNKDSCMIPLLVHKCIEFIYPKHIEEEGIFRKSGSSTSIEQFKMEMSPFRLLSDEFFAEKTDPHLITGLLKAFFRDLPNPFLKNEVHSNIVKIFEAETPENEIANKNVKIKEILEFNLGYSEYETFISLCFLLHEIQKQQDKNLMTAMNLALVFAPNLVNDSSATIDEQMQRNNKVVNYLTYIITHFDVIFTSFENVFIPKPLEESGLDAYSHGELLTDEQILGDIFPDFYQSKEKFQDVVEESVATVFEQIDEAYEVFSSPKKKQTTEEEDKTDTVSNVNSIPNFHIKIAKINYNTPTTKNDRAGEIYRVRDVAMSSEEEKSVVRSSQTFPTTHSQKSQSQSNINVSQSQDKRKYEEAFSGEYSPSKIPRLATQNNEQADTAASCLTPRPRGERPDQPLPRPRGERPEQPTPTQPRHAPKTLPHTPAKRTVPILEEVQSNGTPKLVNLEKFHQNLEDTSSDSFASSAPTTTIESYVQKPATEKKRLVLLDLFHQSNEDTCSQDSFVSSASTSSLSCGTGSAESFSTPSKKSSKDENGYSTPSNATPRKNHLSLSSKKKRGTPVSSVRRGFESIGKSFSGKKSKRRDVTEPDFFEDTTTMELKPPTKENSSKRMSEAVDTPTKRKKTEEKHAII